MIFKQTISHGLIKKNGAVCMGVRKKLIVVIIY